MRRSDYSEDLEQWDLIRWRGAVASAIRGKRGQAFLRELVEALDAMPEKKLIAGDLQNEKGEYCAMGCVGAARGIDMQNLDVYDHESLAEKFGISDALLREVEFINDDTVYASKDEDADAKRWRVVRRWAASQLKTN